MLEEIQRDLFSYDKTYRLAHCVSRDLHMGKGIAVQFKQRFNHVTELKNQKKTIGETAVLKVNERYVYYLITKEKYWGFPTYNSLKMSLLDMRNHAVETKVSTIVMPRIGSGLDKLSWGIVKVILEEVFTPDFGIKVKIN